MATIRARAEAIAHGIKSERLSPLDIGYLAIFLSLDEAANQVRYLVGQELSGPRLQHVADQLDALAEYAIELGEAHTESKEPS